MARAEQAAGSSHGKVIPISRERGRTARAEEGIRDIDLIERALDGDLRAKDALFQRHSNAVTGMLIRLIGSRVDVDDVLHDSFLDAFNKLHRLRNPDAFKPWVMEIAVSRGRKLLRRRRFERALGLCAQEEDATLELLAQDGCHPAVREALGRIDELLRRLPVNQRIAWMLRHVEGYTLEEVAGLCDCSLATAKRRIRAAHAKVQARVPLKEVGHVDL